MREVLRKDCRFFAWKTSTMSTCSASDGGGRDVGNGDLALRGKEGPLGIIAVGSTQQREVSGGRNRLSREPVANLLGLTLQNVRLFEQVATAQQQWAYTFDSIGDPILVHDREFRISARQSALSHLLGRESAARWSAAAVDRVSGAEKCHLRSLPLLRRRCRRRRRSRSVAARIFSGFELDVYGSRQGRSSAPSTS